MNIQTIGANLKDLYRQIYVIGKWWTWYYRTWIPAISETGLDRVLDAGCGQGQALGVFRRQGVTVNYYGVDLGVGDPNWNFRVSAVADLHHLPFRDRSFHKVICDTVLEHVDQPEVVIAEIFRVLVPGGKVFLAVPFVWHMHQRPYDRFRFTSDGLEYLAKKTGFQVEYIRPMGGFFSVLRYQLLFHGLIFEKFPSWVRFLASLFRRLAIATDQVLIAPLCYALDALDREPMLTLGYFVCFKKPLETTNKALPVDPYSCPKCKGESSFSKSAKTWECRKCQRRYEVRQEVPILTMPHSYVSATDSIRSAES